MSHLVKRYQEAERQLVQSDRYDGRDDFTVELQTFSRAANGPSSPREREDEDLIRFLKEFQPWTPECFHFNQKGMAYVSIALWNNLMEPVGNKTESFRLFTHRDIKCPTKTAPYIFTKKNSINYYKTGSQ
ncbi:hypothetical protein J437_LFUL016032 [Ladona fulva]|uniref:Uncharacterized protein n=1 Tax=Ladona fulva TaxID=123851 RepID=A0A8K0KI38_LADFU|nr:hypothetical protein J437_LFUL016032 [Ladona fulva]